MFPQDKLKPTHLIEVDTGAKLVFYRIENQRRYERPHAEHVYAPFHVMAELEPTDGLVWMFNHPFNGEPCCVGVSHARPILSWHMVIIHPEAAILNLQTNEIVKGPAERIGPIAAFTPHLPPGSQPESMTSRVESYYFTLDGAPCFGMSFNFLPGHEVEKYDEAKHAQDREDD